MLVQCKNGEETLSWTKKMGVDSQLIMHTQEKTRLNRSFASLHQWYTAIHRSNASLQQLMVITDELCFQPLDANANEYGLFNVAALGVVTQSLEPES